MAAQGDAFVKPRLKPAAAGRRAGLSLRRAIFRAEDYLYGVDKRLLFLLLLALEAAIFWVDLETDPMVIVAPYYVLPIVCSAWFLDRRLTYCLIATAILARVYAYRLVFSDSAAFLYWQNLLLTACAYSVLEFLVWRVKQLVTRLALHADHLQRYGRSSQRARRLAATIRRALPTDADEIVRLTILGAQAGAFAQAALTRERQLELSALIRQTVSEGRGRRDLWQGGQATVPMDYWLSVVNGAVAGYIMVIGLGEEKDAARELHAVVVSESHRRLGIGSAMTDFFCAHFKQRRLIVACKAGSRMMAMMERRGFRQYANAQGYSLLEKLA